MARLKQILDRFYSEYDFRDRILHDPIEFPHRYKRVEDIEVTSFLASCFAYGRVDLFRQVIEKIIEKMGCSPYEFLSGFRPKRHGKLFSGIRYRFNRNEDIVCLLNSICHLLKRYGSVEQAFKSFYEDEHNNTGNALTGFVDYLLSIDTREVYGRNIRPDGLVQFFPFPVKGSACKRMNLFLRWMIRDRDIDFGIWKGIPKSKLIIPLDTHIARISRCLGFTFRRSDDWKTAVEITDSLKKLDPEDPLKYDFAICHYGITGLCNPKTGIKGDNCKRCIFKPHLSDR
ncbi:MAG: TIGR02757 family protein [Nitrospirae bacterium]|nr:TIGR02757 family protein [Nitrospirota bacterium]